MVRVASLLALLAAGPAAAEIGFDSYRYACDRDVEIWVTYVGDDDSSGVVLFVEGRQVALTFERDLGDFGARYLWPSDLASYVWEAGISDGRLLWREADKETLLLTCGAVQ